MRLALKESIPNDEDLQGFRKAIIIKCVLVFATPPWTLHTSHACPPSALRRLQRQSRPYITTDVKSRTGRHPLCLFDVSRPRPREADWTVGAAPVAPAYYGQGDNALCSTRVELPAVASAATARRRTLEPGRMKKDHCVPMRRREDRIQMWEGGRF